MANAWHGENLHQKDKILGKEAGIIPLPTNFQSIVLEFSLLLLTIVFYTCIPVYYDFAWSFCNAEHSDAITDKFLRLMTFVLIIKMIIKFI